MQVASVMLAGSDVQEETGLGDDIDDDEVQVVSCGLTQGEFVSTRSICSWTRKGR